MRTSSVPSPHCAALLSAAQAQAGWPWHDFGHLSSAPLSGTTCYIILWLATREGPLPVGETTCTSSTMPSPAVSAKTGTSTWNPSLHWGRSSLWSFGSRRKSACHTTTSTNTCSWLGPQPNEKHKLSKLPWRQTTNIYCFRPGGGSFSKSKP